MFPRYFIKLCDTLWDPVYLYADEPVIGGFRTDGNIDDADTLGHPLGGGIVVESEDHLQVAGAEDEIGSFPGLGAVALHLLEALPVGPCGQVSGSDGVELGDQAWNGRDGADFVEEEEDRRPVGMADEVAHDVGDHGSEQPCGGLALVLLELEEEGGGLVTGEIGEAEVAHLEGGTDFGVAEEAEIASECGEDGAEESLIGGDHGEVSGDIADIGIGAGGEGSEQAFVVVRVLDEGSDRGERGVAVLGDEMADQGIEEIAGGVVEDGIGGVLARDEGGGAAGIGAEMIRLVLDGDRCSIAQEHPIDAAGDHGAEDDLADDSL